MVRAHIRRNSSSPPPQLSLGPLPPTPAPSATTPVSPTQLKREPTPFDELPMSHLISFPIVDSPTSADSIDSNPFDAFHAMQHPYSSYPSSSSLLRDAFDYYRLPANNQQPIHDAMSMSLHGTALKPQLHAHTLPDLSSALAYAAPTQQQQQCIPTSHLFSAAQAAQAAQTAPPLKHSSPPLDSEDGSPAPQSSSSQSQPQKKRPPRAAISTKDFVPPDVSGLSKREARLVKNRAAAFLSRQRKREEFETMEVRVAQLEQENARLLALTRSQSQSRSSSPAPSSKPAKSEPGDAQPDAELASLRSLLSQSRTRAAELEAELTRLRSAASSSTPSSSDAGSDAGSPGAPVQVKRESGPDVLPKRAGLFGVVLLCALPTLLSLPAPVVPYAASRFSFTPGPGASSAHHHTQPESLLDWTGMEVDESDVSAGSRAERDARRKVHLPLSFLNGQAGANGFGDLFQGSGLGYALSPSPELDSSPFSDGQTEAEFDVSFAPSSASGKIRVRIESPSEPPVPGLTREGSSPPSSLGSGSPSLAFASTTSSGSSCEGWDLDFAPERAHEMMWDSPTAGANVDVSLFAPASSQAMGTGRRRVRIALKHGPVAGAEGGEWEVEVR